MRNKLGGLCLLTALVITSLATPLYAGNTPVKTVIAPRYEASKEVTMEGTIQSVKSDSPGSMIGMHLFHSESTIDAHMSPSALHGTHASGQSRPDRQDCRGNDHCQSQQGVSARNDRNGQSNVNVRTTRGFVLMVPKQGTYRE